MLCLNISCYMSTSQHETLFFMDDEHLGENPPKLLIKASL